MMGVHPSALQCDMLILKSVEDLDNDGKAVCCYCRNNESSKMPLIVSGSLPRRHAGAHEVGMRHYDNSSYHTEGMGSSTIGTNFGPMLEYTVFGGRIFEPLVPLEYLYCCTKKTIFDS